MVSGPAWDGLAVVVFTHRASSRLECQGDWLYGRRAPYNGLGPTVSPHAPVPVTEWKCGPVQLAVKYRTVGDKSPLAACGRSSSPSSVPESMGVARAGNSAIYI